MNPQMKDRSATASFAAQATDGLPSTTTDPAQRADVKKAMKAKASPGHYWRVNEVQDIPKKSVIKAVSTTYAN